MTPINSALKRRAKSLVERALGVRIERASPNGAGNQHADATVSRLRSWSSRDVVFDVGANDGRTILRIADRLPSPQIYAFEPVASTYQTLVERTRHLENVRCFQLALGAKPGREKIYLNEIAAMNSLLPEWAPSTGSETVEVATVDGLMAQHGIDFVHFLKIDTEGYELEVLAGAQGALQSSRVAIIQVEVGFDQMKNKRFATLEDVRRHLAPMGYVLYGIYNQCRAKARPPKGWPAPMLAGYDASVLVYCDAVFLRADLDR